MTCCGRHGAVDPPSYCPSDFTLPKDLECSLRLHAHLSSSPFSRSYTRFVRLKVPEMAQGPRRAVGRHQVVSPGGKTLRLAPEHYHLAFREVGAHTSRSTRATKAGCFCDGAGMLFFSLKGKGSSPPFLIILERARPLPNLTITYLLRATPQQVLGGVLPHLAHRHENCHHV